MAATVIEIRDVTRHFQAGSTEVRALDGVSIRVERGEFIAIMGPSGSGKSTFMNLVGCLDRPTSGSYLLEGVEVTSLSRDERAAIRNDRLGFVFQNFNLLPRTSALENVELPLLYSRSSTLSQAERSKKALSCLERVGLAKRAEHGPSQMSGGEQQRVAIARSLVNDPSLMLADEPTGNLDSKTSDEIMALFQELNAEGRTLIVVTHEPDIAACARRLVSFKDGRILTDAPVQVRRILAAPARKAAS